MAKDERAERKPRKRLGEWRREQRVATVPGVGQVPATVVVVTYAGHTWEVPDTKEGRHRASEAIQGVIAHERDVRQVGRLREQVRRLIDRAGGEASNCLAKAADLLATAAEHMER